MAFINQYHQDSWRQVSSLIANSQLVDTANGPVEFAQCGSGPSVILSHGSLGGYDQGLWLAGLLGSGMHYLAPSRFGYLRASLPTDASPIAQADHYAALLDALHVDRATVIGLSAGGLSALQFALRHPDRCTALVMLSAISHQMTDMPRFFKVLFFGLMKTNFLPWLLFRFSPASIYCTNGVNRALLARISQDAEKMDLLCSLARTSMLPAMRRAGMRNDWEQATQMPTYPLAMIDVPTLVVHAVNDPVVPFEFGRYSTAHIPGARMLQVEDGGHFCCITHREKVVPEIVQVLKTAFS